ncbi:MAG: hypothetical protein ACRC8C_01945 [Mycoplasmoidaceae bacterium]
MSSFNITNYRKIWEVTCWRKKFQHVESFKQKEVFKTPLMSAKNILLTKYLYYYFLENNEVIKGFFLGASIKHPNMQSIIEMEINLPPIKKTKINCNYIGEI